MNNLIEILSAFAQILIASAVAYVAWQNYKINSAGFYVNKDQLRLSLFERRYKIFEAFRTFLINFVIIAKIDNSKFSEFIFKTIDTEFLFGKEVVKYRQEIIDNCISLKQLHLRLEKGIADETELRKLAEKAESIEEWLANQEEQIIDIFRKYLHFSIDASPK